MSVKLMSQVWGLAVSRERKLVLMALADHANDDGYCYPSAAYVAWKTEYSERQIQRLLDQLEKDRLVRVAQEHTPTTPRIYQLTLDNAKKKDPYVRKPSGRGDIYAVARGDISTSRGDISSARGDIAMSPEPSLEPSKEPSSLVRGQKTPAAPTESQQSKTAKTRIAAALQEFGERADKERAAAIADPCAEQRLFVKEIAPLVAQCLGRAAPIGEDRAATRDIREFKCDKNWLIQKLEHVRFEPKDGQKPNAYWVRNEIEREWQCEKERRQDVSNAKRDADDYDERMREAEKLSTAFADLPDPWQAMADSLHLYAPPERPKRNGLGADARGRKPVDAP